MEKQMFMAIGVVGLVLAGLSAAYADIPLMINHQGLVKVDGFPFDGTGYFRFAIVDPDSGYNVWTNDGTKEGTDQTPTSAVNLAVVKGSYNVRLGDVSISSMTAIPSTVFDDDNIVLRVWFSDGTHGTERLEPDQAITSAAYAYHALTADSAATAGDADTVDGQDAAALMDVPPGAMVLGPTDNHAALIASGYIYTGTSLREQGWSSKAPMPTGRRYCAAATVDGVVYVIGGESSATSYETANEAYDPVSNSWSVKAPMPTGRLGVAAEALDGVIYAIGGAPTETTNEAYDPLTNSWTTKAPMPTGRHYLAAASLGGTVYAIGGVGATAYETANEAYDPLTNSWTTKAAIPTGRQRFSVSDLGGVIYAIGGLSSAADFETANETYDPSTNSWSTKTPMPTGRRSLVAVVVDKNIYAIGGRSSGTEYQTANEAYDPASDSWSTKTAMATGRKALAAAVVNGVPYIIGGQSPAISRQTLNEAYIPTGLYVYRKD